MSVEIKAQSTEILKIKRKHKWKSYDERTKLENCC